ncbi:anoctamin [Plakobranchus ocellatus]|uniref:Anoctamin n=1 Tax=Plakobranchus ocellatus TaxID=259542 RepID=A0AAV4DCZ6_9GAST|nr:anoctamin [Plakobranchus ocellatus]
MSSPVDGDSQPPPPIGFEPQDGASNQRDGLPSDVVNITVQDEENGGAYADNINLLERSSQSAGAREALDESDQFFADGQRRIDYVLVHEPDPDPEDEPRKAQNRKNFEANLIEAGLQLEYVTREMPQDSGKIEKQEIHYVKVHAPWDFLTRYAEYLNIKMPLAKNDMTEKFDSCWSKFPTPFDYDESILPEIPDFFTAPFSRQRERQFIIEDRSTFFTPAQRSLLVHQFLSRAVFEDVGDRAKNKFGIKRMLSNGSYTAAYPLHDGEYIDEDATQTQGPDQNLRQLLYQTWARAGVWHKFQPLDHVRLYFGEKIAIYFSWLGFYTGLLVPAGLVGLIIFLYGCIRLPYNQTSKDICDEDGIGNLTMCPLCDGRCTYWRLARSCVYSRLTSLFDNEATVAFAAFMALWSAFFHEMWKRKEAEIEYDWDVADYEEEETIRPEFEASVRRRRINPINKAEEPYLTFTSRVCRLTSSLWAVVFMLCVVIAAVFAVIVYRTTVSALLYAVDQESVKERAATITSITAACINLVIIIILGRVYLIVARVLTNFELHRTLTEWEDSFTLKMFLFQFVNHYASLFYIAFFKGKLIGRPGHYNRELEGARQEECDPAGCLIELCIQLAIIMVGKQAINNFTEIILPKVMNWFKSRKIKEMEEKKKEKVARWERDYTMATMPELGLFDEYLEMVLQFGFVTIFVAAFPLAPLFALLNNILEIRIDAYKFITQWRRPLAMRAQDIGIWFGILRGISAIAIMTNASIIAFTSEFIPKLVYRYAYSPTDDLEGFVNFTLSVFNVSDFEPDSIPSDPKTELFGNVTFCRYRDFRAPPDAERPYKFTIEYWHVLTARLAFVIVFVISVWLLTWFVAFLVPDVPQAVKLQMLREKYLGREALLEAEHLRPGKITDSSSSQKDGTKPVA